MRIVRASDGFILRRAARPRYPIVVCEDLGVVTPIDAYLRHGLTRCNRAIGSLYDEAGVLKLWWSWVHEAGREARPISSYLLAEWHGEQLSLAKLRPGSRTKATARIDRCLRVIQSFHSFLLETRDTSPRLRSQAVSHNYVARLVVSDVADPGMEIRYSVVPKRTGPGRPTPTPRECEAVLESLASHTDDLTAQRNYLIGMWQSQAGLRACGVSALTMRALLNSLREVGLSNEVASEAAKGKVASQRETLRFVGERIRLGQRFFYPLVKEKGGRDRFVAAPAAVVDETLRFVWSCSWRRVGDAVFVSKKTGRGLQAGSVADIVARSFRQSAVRGSGHRLRAAYAEAVVQRLYEDGLSRLGALLDDRQVLIEAAELLGHRHWRTLTSYLNNAKRNAILANE